MAKEILDVNEIIKKWARDFPLDRDLKKLAVEEILTSDINLKHFKVKHSDPTYEDSSHVANPNTHVLFSAVFTNSTDQPQTYSFRTERKTKSTCELTMEKGYMYEAAFDIKMAPPNPVIEANAGFRRELTLSKAQGQIFEHELTWEVDSSVAVPPGYQTTADLVIREQEYNGHFFVKSKFAGKVHVSLRNKKDGSVLTTLTGDVKHIFTPDKGFQVDKTGIYCITEGTCQCRFGIEQHVKLTQRALDNSEEREA